MNENLRHLLLQEMGITQWQLVRPEVLKGMVVIQVAENIRLIVVSDENISQQPLLADVLLAFGLTAENCLCLNFEQLQHVVVSHSVDYWLLSQNFPHCPRNLINARQVFLSANWQQFKSDSQQKRQLWQQIQIGTQ